MDLSIFSSDFFTAFWLFIAAFSLTLFLIPRVRENSLKFGLYDTPEARSSHKTIVPTFGGVAFFISIFLALFFIKKWDLLDNTISLMVSLTIMFFVGLKDDLQNLSARKKFLGQIIAVFLLVLEPEFRIQSLHGLLGIQELHPFLSIIFSIFIVLGLINAYNLIDGIDGLASIVGIIILSFFGFLFYKLDLTYYLLICVVSVATLLAFLRYNLSTRKKIFMGDTGSLVIGLVIGLLMLKLLSLGSNSFEVLAIERKHIPLLIVSILIIPIFDFHRVLIVRMIRKQSLFSPDRNHMHHVLLDTGLSHIQASIICGFLNIVTILFVFYSLREFSITTVYIEVLIYVALLSIIFFGLNKSIAARRVKVRFRSFLFDVTSKLFSFTNKSFTKNKLAFNSGLKKIRIFFF